MLRKSVAHPLLNFAANPNGMPPRRRISDMRFRFTRECFVVAGKIEQYDSKRKNDIG